MAVSASSLVVDDHIFLNGRPPLGEYLGFIVGQTVDGAIADRARLAAEWRAANDRVKELERTEAGIADNAELGELPESIAPRAATALQHPGVQQSYALMPASIAMVELDNAVVYQKAINLGQVTRLQSKLGNSPSEEQVFDVCFPLDRELDPPFGAQEGGDGWTFVSPSNDFRFLGARLLAPTDVPDSFGMPGAP